MEYLIPVSIIVMINIFMLGLGLWIFLQKPSSRVNVAFFMIVVSFVIWSVPHIFLQLPDIDVNSFRFWVNMNFIGPSLFLVSFVYFSYIFPKDNARLSQVRLFLIFLPAIFTIPAAMTQQVSVHVVGLNGDIYWGWAFYVFYLMMFSYLLWGSVNFYRKMHEKGSGERRAISLVFIGIISGTVAGLFFASFLPLVFNYPDLLYLGPGASGLLFAVFCGYAVIRYELMELHVIAKQALFYTVTVVVATFLLSSVVLVSNRLEESYPMLAFWLVPAVFSALAVILGSYIWNATRSAELLRNEFLTIVTHKFRTPLTRAFWSIEDLKMDDLSESQMENVRMIEHSNKKILELVDLSTDASGGGRGYSFSVKRIDLSEVLREVIAEYKGVAERKGINFEGKMEDGVFVMAERKNLKFVISVLIDNSLTYTPKGGSVVVTLTDNGEKAILSVKDDGIGVSKESQRLIFSPFFRGGKARLEHTEGMGVGLYISRNLIENFDGNAGFHSEGIGKGSLFFFEIPICKEALEER